MLEIETVGGRQKAYCWNTEGIFRLIQSIPSPMMEETLQEQARKDLEKKSGRRVSTKQNYLKIPEKLLKR